MDQADGGFAFLPQGANDMSEQPKGSSSSLEIRNRGQLGVENLDQLRMERETRLKRCNKRLTQDGVRQLCPALMSLLERITIGLCRISCSVGIDPREEAPREDGRQIRFSRCGKRNLVAARHLPRIR